VSDTGRARVDHIVVGEPPTAQVDIVEEDDLVEVRFTMSRTHLPVTLRRDLVEAAFSRPALRGVRRVAITVPLGDAELLDRLESRLADVHRRAAGSTCLIDAKTRDP
jgi:hypothetical protein